MKKLTSIILLTLIIILSCNTQLNKKGNGIKTNIDGNRSNISINKNTESKNYLGKYRVIVSGFEGNLHLYKEKNKFSGTISFKKWGYGKKHVLKDVRINVGKIYFVRSLTTVEELKKFNSNRYFNQNYYGRFSKDGLIIKGYYRDSGGQHSWKGIKITK